MGNKLRNVDGVIQRESELGFVKEPEDSCYEPKQLWWKFYRTPRICVRTSTGRYVQFYEWPFYAIRDWWKNEPKRTEKTTKK